MPVNPGNPYPAQNNANPSNVVAGPQLSNSQPVYPPQTPQVQPVSIITSVPPRARADPVIRKPTTPLNINYSPRANSPVIRPENLPVSIQPGNSGLFSPRQSYPGMQPTSYPVMRNSGLYSGINQNPRTGGMPYQGQEVSKMPQNQTWSSRMPYN